MSLTIHPLPLAERWDCQQCGQCCRGSIIRLSAAEVTQIELQQWGERPEYRGKKLIVGRGSEARLAQQPDGSCVFLSSAGLCRIHQEFGADAKPLTCQLFPLQLVPQQKQAVLTLRRACPSAAADEGRDITQWLPEVKRFVAQGDLIAEPVTAPPFKPGEPRDWQRTRIVLEALRRITQNERFPPIHRLVQGVEFCRLLEAAQTTDFANEKLAELMRVLEENLPEEVAPYFEDRQLPSGGTKILFRQMALEVVRLHPQAATRRSWSTRLQMLWWALRMVRGRGLLPQVHPKFPAVRFDDLELPIGKLDPTIYQPLFRYFETTTASYQYALANKSGWSVIESYRELALFYPLALWLLRWASHGRTATRDDMLGILTALDRAQGYEPLTGRKQRSRISTLVKLDGLPKLIAWYGR